MLKRRDVLTGLAAISASAGLSIRSQASDTTLIAPAVLQSDLALLKRVYTNLHPGLYRYATPAQIEARFNALSTKFARALPLPSVYLELSKLLASVRCGHSYANFYSQTEAVQNQLFAGRNRMPFRFVWLKNVMVVTDPAGVSGLAKGTRITRINTVPTRQILNTLLPYVRADGHNIGKQISLLSVDRDEAHQTFDIFYALYFGATDRFALQGKSPDGASFNLSVTAIDLPTRRAMTARASLSNTDPVWSLQIRDDKIAVMTMPTWGLYRTSWDWKAWLTTSFAAINNAACHALILDIRGNEGGRDDCGPEILGYLTDKPLPPQAGQRRIRYRTIPSDLNPILDTWDDSFRNWGDKAVLRTDGMYDLNDQQGRSGGSVTPKMPRFSGKVVVLTDASNSSATLQFCQMLRANGLGKIVGGTTGGNLRGINAEKFMFCRLPGTGLEVDVPLVGFFPDGTPADSGLVPDVAVVPTWTDVASGTDQVMARATAYLAMNR